MDSLVIAVGEIPAIESYLRPGSKRHFVEVSDDESMDMTADYFDHIVGNRPGFSDYVFHSIVATTQPTSPGFPGSWGPGPAWDGSIGYQYLELSNRTGGITADIHGANWQQVFDALGAEVAHASMEYKLSRAPVAGSVKVTFDGQPAVQGIDYDIDLNALQLILTRVLRNEANIEVCYEY